ncbi:MAG: Fe-Mn family superoxide dismutase [bacterium]
MVTQAQQIPGKREYQPHDYERLIGTRGFSEPLLRTHFELYSGYVKHANKCLELLRATGVDPYAAGEVRRRLVWEFNGMRLHELYFDGMVSGGREMTRDSPLRQALVAEHGSLETWWARFQTVGGLRGIGWAALCHDPQADRFINCWINEHDAGIFAGTTPILVLDLFEHAYMRDYNTDRWSYINAFNAAIDWTVCETRLKQSRKLAPPGAPAA